MTCSLFESHSTKLMTHHFWPKRNADLIDLQLGEKPYRELFVFRCRILNQWTPKKSQKWYHFPTKTISNLQKILLLISVVDKDRRKHSKPSRQQPVKPTTLEPHQTRGAVKRELENSKEDSPTDINSTLNTKADNEEGEEAIPLCSTHGSKWPWKRLQVIHCRHRMFRITCVQKFESSQSSDLPENSH